MIALTCFYDYIIVGISTTLNEEVDFSISGMVYTTANDPTDEVAVELRNSRGVNVDKDITNFEGEYSAYNFVTSAPHSGQRGKKVSGFELGDRYLPPVSNITGAFTKGGSYQIEKYSDDGLNLSLTDTW